MPKSESWLLTLALFISNYAIQFRDWPQFVPPGTRFPPIEFYFKGYPGTRQIYPLPPPAPPPPASGIFGDTATQKKPKTSTRQPSRISETNFPPAASAALGKSGWSWAGE
ncbi:unnamed protein product, partial [Mesorhabditis spiculigera]